MSDTIVRSATDIAPYEGPNEIPGIRFRAAAAALGVRAWGMNVIDMDANCQHYPEHDHAADGQEELYVILEGSATLVAGEQRHELRRGDLARVGPSTTRKLIPGDSGVTLLAIGGTPGQAYPASG